MIYFRFVPHLEEKPPLRDDPFLEKSQCWNVTQPQLSQDNSVLAGSLIIMEI